MKIIATSLILISILFAPFSFINANNGFIDKLMPDNPFYFIKTFKERISLILTIDPLKRAQKALEYSKEKLKEAEKMANSNNKEGLKRALSSYHFYLGLIKNMSLNKNINLTEIKEKINQYTNTETVKKFYEQLPPPNKSTFKVFIERGINTFKRIYLFLIELVFEIKNFLQNLVKQIS